MREPSPAGSTVRLHDALVDLLETCDADVMARRLGLRSAAAANALRKNTSAVNRLTANLMVGQTDPQATLAAAEKLFPKASP